MHSIFLSLILLLHISLGISEKEVCFQQTPCSCLYSDGYGIDLNPITAPPNAPLQLQLSNTSQLFVNFCNDIQLGPPGDKNLCSKASLCLKTNDTYTPIGLSSEATFDSEVGKEKASTLVYKHNDIKISILLACVSNYDTTFLKEKSLFASEIELFLLSSHSCVQDLTSSSHLSTGSVLVILFLLFSTIYLVGGAAILHFLRGASGMEMIPNIDFWMDLPKLVREGVVFMQNGCTVASAANTYDQI